MLLLIVATELAKRRRETVAAGTRRGGHERMNPGRRAWRPRLSVVFDEMRDR